MKQLTPDAYSALRKAAMGPKGFHFHLTSNDFAHHPKETKLADTKSPSDWYAANAGVHKDAAKHHRTQAGNLMAGAGLFPSHPDISSIIQAKADAHSHLANMHDAGASRSKERVGYFNWMKSPGTDWYNHGLPPKAGSGELGTTTSRPLPAVKRPERPRWA